MTVYVDNMLRAARVGNVTATVRERALNFGAIPMQYGREGGLFSMLKRARQSGDPEAVAKAEQMLAEERARLAGEVQSNG